MKELRFVDLSDNRLASIHGLDNCPHLLELCVSDNRVARVSGGLPKCSGLQVLDIDSNLLINCRVSTVGLYIQVGLSLSRELYTSVSLIYAKFRLNSTKVRV